MLIDGEKWACDACVRGHRVSNCQHSDRPLSHIAKKGRPVSQCAHCRNLRKSRSAHVKCDCGEKIALHAKGPCIHYRDVEKDSCTCSLGGGGCSCAGKKDHRNPVPEFRSDEASSATNEKLNRPRVRASRSEHALTIFTNGHHKPSHKHNQMAHKCGLPYSLPRAHSIHGPSPSLGLANRSVDNLPHTNTIDALHSESHIKDSMIRAQQEQRLIKSEHGSPHLVAGNEFDHFYKPMAPLDLTALEEYPADFNNMLRYETYTPIDEAPIFSAGLTAPPIDWSLYEGLNFNNDEFATTSYSQAQSFTGIDYGSIEPPTLTTTTTSGDVSEVEDFGSMPTRGPVRRMVSQAFGSEASDLGDRDGYRLSNASSYMALDPARLPADGLHYLNADAYRDHDAGPAYTMLPPPGLPAAKRPTDAPYLLHRPAAPHDLHFALAPLATDEPDLWMKHFAAHLDACDARAEGPSHLAAEENWHQ